VTSSVGRLAGEIHVGDCETIREHLGDRRADFCFIDPPYNQGKPYADGIGDKLPLSSYWGLVKRACALGMELTGGRMAVLVSVKLLPIWMSAIAAHNPTALHTIAVRKRAKGVRINGLFNQWVPIIATARPVTACPDLWDDIRLPGEGYFFREARPEHPAPTSLELTKRVIEHFTRPGDLVIDFFAGAGATMLASSELGRDFVGVEASATYVDCARARWETEFGG